MFMKSFSYVSSGFTQFSVSKLIPLFLSEFNFWTSKFLQVCLHINIQVRFFFLIQINIQKDTTTREVLCKAKQYLLKLKLDIFRAREATTNIKQVHTEAKFGLK